MDKRTYDILKEVESPLEGEQLKEFIKLYAESIDYEDFYCKVNGIDRDKTEQSKASYVISRLLIDKERGKKSSKYVELCKKLEECRKKYCSLIEDEFGFKDEVYDTEKINQDEEIIKIREELKEIEENNMVYENLPDKEIQFGEQFYWGFVEKNFERKDKELLRIYLNVKGEDKVKLIKEYMEQCEERKMPYQFKYSLCDNRQDEVIFFTSLDDLADNVEIITDITKDMELGELPMMNGRYREKIGIVSDDEERSAQSFNLKRITMFGVALSKYMLDHMEEILPLCNEEEKECLKKKKEFLEEEISYSLEDIESDKETLEKAKESGDTKKIERYEKSIKREQNRINNYKENLIIDEHSRIWESRLPELINTIKGKITYTPEVLDEISSNYELVASRVSLSKNAMFTVELESEMEKARGEYDKSDEKQEGKTELQKREERLSELERGNKELINEKNNLVNKNNDIGE